MIVSRPTPFLLLPGRKRSPPGAPAAGSREGSLPCDGSRRLVCADEQAPARGVRGLVADVSAAHVHSSISEETYQHGVLMHGRKLFSTGPVATILTVVALIGGCREASTGPSDPNNSAFASSMQLVSGNSQVGQIGSTLSQLLTVKVMDAGGLPVQGASVTFAARTGGGAIVPPSGTSNAAGLVTATWTLGTTLGAQTAVAKLTNSFVNDSSNFTATATPGAGTGFAIVSGNNQTAHVGHALALPLVVKVTDSFGNNISGITVTWVAGALSGSVTPATDTTPDTGRIVTIVSGNSQVASITSALTALSVRVTDQFGNPIVGDSVTWTDSLMGGGKVSATRTGTDATGIARTTWTLGARAGTQFLRAREASNGLTAGFTATATVAFSDVESGNFQTCWSG